MKIIRDYKLAILFSSALIIRLGAAFIYQGPFHNVAVANSRALSGEGSIDITQAPLYPLFLRLIYFIFGSYNYRMVFIIQGIISSFTIILMYKLSRKIGNREAGLIAAALCAVYPNFILYNLTILPDSGSLFLVVSIMTMMGICVDRKRKASVSALLTGWGTMLDPVFLFFSPGLFIALKKRWTFLLILIGVLFPWAVRNTIVHHGIVPLYQISVFKLRLIQFVQARDGWDTIDYLYFNASSLLGKGWRINEMGGLAASGSALDHLMRYSYTVLMAIGLFALIRVIKKEHLAVILPVVVFGGWHLFFSTFEPRLRIFMEPLYILYISLWAGRLCEKHSLIKSELCF